MSTAKQIKYSVPKLPDVRFTPGKSAENNRVFLFENHSEFPFIRPVEGWRIIGWGKAPWPGNTEGFAVMFEKTVAAKEYGRAHEEMPEGSRIWQHYQPSWLEGHPDFEERSERAAARATPEKLTPDEELVLGTYRDLRDNNDLDEDFIEDEQRIIELGKGRTLTLTLDCSEPNRVIVPDDEIGEGSRGDEAE